MSVQKVDTDAIAGAARSISLADDTINDAFSNLQRLGNSLRCNWRGKAGDAAGSLMNRLFAGNEARSAVLQNYVNLLNQVVVPGHTGAETENSSLSDLFL